MKATGISLGTKSFTGHSVRIGATLEYLLRGTPLDIMKTMGRWSSDAFLLYLRKHAQILAPYLQSAPEIQRTVAHLVQ